MSTKQRLIAQIEEMDEREVEHLLKAVEDYRRRYEQIRAEYARLTIPELAEVVLPDEAFSRESIY